MTLNTVTLFFTKDRGFGSIRLKEAIQGPARISLRSDQIATTGIACIFQKLRSVNERIYQDALGMEDFTVTLSPQAGSKNLGLKIESKNICINLEKLKPETSDFLTHALNPLQRDSLFNTEVIRAESHETPTLLVPFMFMLSALRSMLTFISSCISRPKADDSLIMEPIEQREILRPLEIFPSRLVLDEAMNPSLAAPFVDLDEAEKAETLRLEDLHQMLYKQLSAIPSDPLTYIELKLPKSEVPSLKKTSRCVLLDSKPFELISKDIEKSIPDASLEILPLAPILEDEKNRDSVGQIEQPSVTLALNKTGLEREPASPVLPKNVVIKQEPLEQPSLPIVSNIADLDKKQEVGNIPVKSPRPLTSEEMFDALQVQFTCLFPLAAITNPSTGDGKLFGAYLILRVLGKAESCHFDPITGDFTLTFADERKILLSNLPKELSENGSKKLQISQGHTLHIAKQVKGTIKSDGGITFVDGSLTIQGKKFWFPFKAHLIEINNHPEMSTNHNFGNVLMFKGKMGVSKTESLLAQDFVNLVEANFPKM